MRRKRNYTMKTKIDSIQQYGHFGGNSLPLEFYLYWVVKGGEGRVARKKTIETFGGLVNN